MEGSLEKRADVARSMTFLGEGGQRVAGAECESCRRNASPADAENAIGTFLHVTQFRFDWISSRTDGVPV